MSEPFLGEIKLISWNFPPKGWAFCNGQLMPINQNQALFSILGTTYGGNGQTNFALPDLRSRIPVHVGSMFTLGGSTGEENHTLNGSEMPTHTHALIGTSNPATVNAPTGNFLANSPGNLYAAPAALTPLRPETLPNTGGSQAHTNQQPYLVLNFVIALQGIFPSRN
jgi:microcystin-dependent protein